MNTILITIVGFVVLLLGREVFAWFFKVTDVLDKLKEVSDKIRSIERQLEDMQRDIRK